MLDQILWTACVTPFNASGTQIDFANFDRLLSLQEEAQNGIVLLGSTGESLSLSEEERRQIVLHACGMKLKVPLMVGVPSINLSQALEWIDFCANLPLAGYLMTVPLYTKPGIQGQIAWFKTLLDRVDKPVMLYNIPSRCGIRLHPESVQELSTHPHFAAIKDCSGNVDSLMEYRIAAPHVAVYCGDDYMMPAMAAGGAVGLVSVASNAWPHATRTYVKAALESTKISSLVWWKTSKTLFSASNPIPLKALMYDMGLLENATVRLPLSLEDNSCRELLVELSEQILQWEKTFS